VRAPRAQAAVGWVISVVERHNPHLGSISRGAYWGLMSFLNAADEKPGTRLGRFLTIIWLMSNLISLSIITCARATHTHTHAPALRAHAFLHVADARTPAWLHHTTAPSSAPS
jgi:hypothetical protein